MGHAILIGVVFIFGELTYMAMRAHFQVRGPRPLATGYDDYIARCWGPLLFRFVVENAVFWFVQNPLLAEAGLRVVGWESLAFYCTLLRFVPTAIMAGLFGDVLLDFAVVKLPIVKDYWPQMPPPLPQPAVVEAQVVEQTTKVTQLQSKTVVAKDKTS